MGSTYVFQLLSLQLNSYVDVLVFPLKLCFKILWGDTVKSEFIKSASALAVVLSVFSASSVRADGFEAIDLLAGDDNGSIEGVSGDGSVVVGESNAGGNFHAFRWTANGGTQALGYLPGDGYSTAVDVSDNGSVIVGSSRLSSVSSSEAYIWTAGDGLTGLGFLPGGDTSTATAISGDGLVVVGSSNSTIYTSGEAFRWTSGGGMTALGNIGGFPTISTASALSYDGSVVVGSNIYAFGMFHTIAYRWTIDDGMTSLGLLSGYTSTGASAISSDGSVVYGTASNNGGTSEGFRWTEADGLSGLGWLPGGSHSSVVDVSADGTIVLGESDSTGNIIDEAVLWSEAQGMRSVKNLLAEAGVDTSGWSLDDAGGISSDGTIIVGTGNDPQNEIRGWIAICSSALCTGFVTPENIAASFSSVGTVGQTGNAFTSGQLGSFGEMATQHKAGGAPVNVFGSGFYDSDPVAAASVGATVDLDDGIVIGGSFGQSLVETPMIYEGESRIWGTSIGGFVSSNPDAGLQWVLAASASYFTGSIDRQYLNGVAIAQSSGDVKGNGYGALARLGYSVVAGEQIRLTPFASYTFSKAHIDGYAETNGPVPARFGDIDDTAQTLRLGSDLRYSFAPQTWTWGTLAWAHRLDDARTAGVSGVLLAGVLPLTTPGAAVAENWLEATVGVHIPLSDDMSLMTSVTAVVPDGYSTTYQARIGLSYAF